MPAPVSRKKTGTFDDYLFMHRGTLKLWEYDEQQIPALEAMVAEARDRLAELLARHGILRTKVNVALALAFKELGPYREKQELLTARLALLQWRLEGIMNHDDTVEEKFHEQWKATEDDVTRRYREATDGLEGKGQEEPTGDRAERLREVWKKLVSVYHPDRHHNDPARKKYECLMAAINRAKDDGDLETLEKIAEDPDSYARDHGWDLNDAGPSPQEKDRMQELSDLLGCLRSEIEKVEKEISDFLVSDDYALYELWKESRWKFRKCISAMRKALIADIQRLEYEIEEMECRINVYDSVFSSIKFS
ncbi:MAG: hypothetical protein VB980_00555 [Opitutales bacterium]